MSGLMVGIACAGAAVVRAMTAALGILTIVVGIATAVPGTWAWMALVVMTTSIAGHETAGRVEPITPSARRRFTCRAAATGACATLVVAGLVWISGDIVAGSAAVTLAAVWACWLSDIANPGGVCGQIRRTVRAVWRPRGSWRVTDRSSLNDVCRVWRLSRGELDDARGDAERLSRINDLRARCLDELFRRDPDGFARWLRAGAATHDPTAFLSEQTVRPASGEAS